MNTNETSKKDDQKIAMLFSAFFSYNLITLLVNTLVNFVFPNTPVDTMLCNIIYAIFILNAIVPMLRNLTMLDFGFVIICITVYMTHSFIYPENYEMLSEMLSGFVFSVLPLYLLGRSIKDYKIVLVYFEKASRALVWVAFAYYLILIIAEMEIAEDNMSFAYYLLPFVIIRFYSMISAFSTKNLIYFLVAVLTLILTGTRGPFLCLLVGIILFILFYQENKQMKFVWCSVLIGCIIFLFTDAFVIVLENINKFLLSYNIENRIIEKILEEEIFNDSGRGVIIEATIDAIKQKPILGYGILGDRVMFGRYVHNIFYELIFQFGCIIGVTMFIVVTVMACKAVFNKARSYSAISILCVSCIYVKLFLSGSYIDEPLFFLMVGIISSKKFIEKDSVKYDKEADKKIFN